MSNTEIINIACTIDDSYVQHCAVMLASLFDNNPKIQFRIFIIHDGISHKKQQNLTEFLDKEHKEFLLINVDKSVFKGVPICEHFSVANYFRILIPKLVDNNIGKILFLDSDMIIRRDITPLWNIDIEEYSHAAVENPRVSCDYKQNLGIAKNSSYFNSGVLLINLQMWRRLNVMQNTIKFIAQHPEKIHYVDQDALNYILENKWLKIESQWNAQKAFFESSALEDLGVTSEEYQQTRYNPTIAHFTGGGSSKPWHFNCSHPFKDEYYKYLGQTPWCNAQPIGKPNFFRRFKTSIKTLIKGSS